MKANTQNFLPSPKKIPLASSPASSSSLGSIKKYRMYSVRRKKLFTPQTNRDHQKMNERIENTPLYFKMEEILRCKLKKDQTKKSWLAYAAKLALRAKIKVDRIAKRNKKCLLCWFCENYNTLGPLMEKEPIIEDTFGDKIEFDLIPQNYNTTLKFLFEDDLGPNPFTPEKFDDIDLMGDFF